MADTLTFNRSMFQLAFAGRFIEGQDTRLLFGEMRGRPVNISRIEIWDFAPPFRDGPYVMSHVTQTHAHGRIIRIHTDDDHSGLGEIIFAPSIPAEKRLTQIASEPDYLSELIGKDIDALMDTAQAMRSRGKASCAAAFGLETAWYDLIGNAEGEPLASLLGKVKTDAVEGYFSVSERTPEAIGKRLSGPGKGARVFQLKIGIGSLDDDTAHVTAALAAMCGDQILFADANGGWTVDQAIEIANRFDDARIVWEEPCPAYDDSAEVARAIRAPVMVDQCVGDLEVATRAAEEAAASSICIKPTFLGGLKPARQILDLCIERKMPVRIDGPWCGDIASAAILHLALGAPPDLCIAGCDLREPLVVEPDMAGVRHGEDGRIAPAAGPGLGITAHELGPPEAVYDS